MTHSHRISLLVLALGVFATAAAPAPALAAVFNVTSLGNSGPNTLRQAILDANGNGVADTIAFSGGLSGTIELASALPQITGEVDIVGPGAEQVTVDANLLGRVLDFGAAPGATHSISGLTLTGGRTFSVDGAGILLQNGQTLLLEEVHLTGNEVTNSSGGGIKAETATTVNVVRSVISHNEAYAGGGAFALGTLNVEESTFHGNYSVLQGGGIAGDLVELYESTVSGNGAPDGEFTIGQGGGIFVFDGGELTMFQVTVVNNVADSGPGVFLLNTAEAVELGGNIIAGNRFDGSGSEGNCNVSLGIAGNNNLSGDASCGFSGVSDIQNTDPELLPLIDAGGPTPTHVPVAGSPVIDQGSALFCIAIDQRGFARPVDGDGVGGAVCDIGSTEYTPANDDALVTIFSDGFESGNTSAWSVTVP